jgi:PAS domain-containing protein
MPYFICPNCRQRSVDHDGLEDLTNEAVGCHHCGFGFLFELMDDYYPGPATGFVVCDQGRRVLATGRGVFELTGYNEADLLGQEITEALGLEAEGDANPAELAIEWGVRRLDQKVSVRTRAGVAKELRADFFPAYDEDGGLLVALSPR